MKAVSNTFFVTGTDTGVGKTYVTSALLRCARTAGIKACGYKPVASGSEMTADGLRNEDALALWAESAPGLRYAQINPLTYAPPIAPHVAAAQIGQPIDLALLDRAHAELLAQHDLVITEGAGGWRVPLVGDVGFDDWVSAHRWPVVLVVGVRLGCINHALLSVESIMRRTRLAGWVANRLPEGADAWQDTLDTLRARIEAPLLGVVPPGGGIEGAAAALRLPVGMAATV